MENNVVFSDQFTSGESVCASLFVLSEGLTCVESVDKHLKSALLVEVVNRRPDTVKLNIVLDVVDHLLLQYVLLYLQRVLKNRVFAAQQSTSKL